MEQITIEQLLTLVPIILILVWFIITCINGFFKKKILYILELLVLGVHFTCDINLALHIGLSSETAEPWIQFIAWAVICLFLVVIVLEDYYKNYYKRRYKK